MKHRGVEIHDVFDVVFDLRDVIVMVEVENVWSEMTMCDRVIVTWSRFVYMLRRQR